MIGIGTDTMKEPMMNARRTAVALWIRIRRVTSINYQSAWQILIGIFVFGFRHYIEKDGNVEHRGSRSSGKGCRSWEAGSMSTTLRSCWLST
jgi:hypothetical protein